MSETYTVSDAGSADAGLTYSEAIERIQEWYEDADEWATGNGDESTHAAIADAIAGVPSPPEGGAFADLTRYADEIRQAVAHAMGGDDHAGHGHYYVSAADAVGLDLSVQEDED